MQIDTENGSKMSRNVYVYFFMYINYLNIAAHC